MEEPPGNSVLNDEDANLKSDNTSSTTTEDDVTIEKNFNLLSLSTTKTTDCNLGHLTNENTLTETTDYKRLYEESQSQRKQHIFQLGLLTTEKEELKKKYDELLAKSRLSLKIDTGDPFVMKKRSKNEGEIIKC